MTKSPWPHTPNPSLFKYLVVMGDKAVIFMLLNGKSENFQHIIFQLRYCRSPGLSRKVVFQHPNLHLLNVMDSWISQYCKVRSDWN